MICSRQLVVSLRQGTRQYYHFDRCNCDNDNLFNSLPNDKILAWSKLKALADDKIKFAEMMIFVFDRVENIVGKVENAGYQHFLLFQKCFQKAFYSGLLKIGLCGKELTLYLLNNFLPCPN